MSYFRGLAEHVQQLEATMVIFGNTLRGDEVIAARVPKQRCKMGVLSEKENGLYCELPVMTGVRARSGQAEPVLTLGIERISL